MGDKAQ